MDYITSSCTSLQRCRPPRGGPTRRRRRHGRRAAGSAAPEHFSSGWCLATPVGGARRRWRNGGGLLLRRRRRHVLAPPGHHRHFLFRRSLRPVPLTALQHRPAALHIRRALGEPLTALRSQNGWARAAAGRGAIARDGDGLNRRVSAARSGRTPATAAALAAALAAPSPPRAAHRYPPPCNLQLRRHSIHHVAAGRLRCLFDRKGQQAGGAAVPGGCCTGGQRRRTACLRPRRRPLPPPGPCACSASCSCPYFVIY